MYHERLGSRQLLARRSSGTTLTFFPMHIVGLLGMTAARLHLRAGPRLGIYNLIETVGGFVLAAGLLLIARQPRSGAPPRRARAGPTRSSAARSSGRCRRRRPPTTSPSSRRSRARTRTGTGRPPRRPRPPRARRARARGRPRDAGDDRPRRRARRDPRDAVASRRGRSCSRASSRSASRLLPDLPLLIAAGCSRPRGARRRRLALERAEEADDDVGRGFGRGGIRRPARPTGWWGMALLRRAEATLFGTIFGTYIYLRVRARRGRPPGTPGADAADPLCSRRCCWPRRSSRSGALACGPPGRRDPALAALVLALAVQAGYFAGQSASSRTTSTASRPIGAPTRRSTTMLGAHHAHVAVGMLLERLVRAAADARRDAVPAHRAAVHGLLLVFRQHGRSACRRPPAVSR